MWLEIQFWGAFDMVIRILFWILGDRRKDSVKYWPKKKLTWHPRTWGSKIQGNCTIPLDGEFEYAAESQLYETFPSIWHVGGHVTRRFAFFEDFFFLLLGENAWNLNPAKEEDDFARDRAGKLFSFRGKQFITAGRMSNDSAFPHFAWWLRGLVTLSQMTSASGPSHITSL